MNFTNFKARLFFNKFFNKTNILKNLNTSQSFKEKILSFYVSNKTDSNILKNSVGHVFGDCLIVCPACKFSKGIASSNQNQVYFYKFSYRGKLNPFACHNSCGGVCHTYGLHFVFGHPILRPNLFTQKDYQFSLFIMKIWTNFAKTG